MQFDQAARHPDMVEAHADDDVLAVVANYIAAPSRELSWLLALALNSNYHPGDHAIEALMVQAPVPDEDRDVARSMVSAALSIGSRFQFDSYRRNCRRGAILEAIGEQLCRQRSAKVDVEQHVGPLPPTLFRNGRSRPLDVLVKEAQLELYECKNRALDIDTDHCAEFDALAELAADEAWPLRLAVVSLQEEDEVLDALEGVTFACDLRIASRETLHLLWRDAAEAPARRPAA